MYHVESNWCVIGDIPSSSFTIEKLSKLIIFDTKLVLFDIILRCIYNKQDDRFESVCIYIIMNDKRENGGLRAKVS